MLLATHLKPRRISVDRFAITTLKTLVAASCMRGTAVGSGAWRAEIQVLSLARQRCHHAKDAVPPSESSAEAAVAVGQTYRCALSHTHAVAAEDAEWEAAATTVKPFGLIGLESSLVNQQMYDKKDWAQVRGLQSVKRRLAELIVWPLRAPAFCHIMKLTGSRGALLYGPPGTGKTVLVRALASEVWALVPE